MKRSKKRKRRLSVLLYFDETEDSLKAANLLRDADFDVCSIPWGGYMGPKAEINGDTYIGIEQIKQLIRDYKNFKMKEFERAAT